MNCIGLTFKFFPIRILSRKADRLSSSTGGGLALGRLGMFPGGGGGGGFGESIIGGGGGGGGAGPPLFSFKVK